MKCLLCSFQFIRESVLKNHHVNYHSINEDDIFVKTCFCRIQLTRHAEFVEKLLKTAEVKKNICFFFIMESDKWVEEDQG